MGKTKAVLFIVALFTLLTIGVFGQTKDSIVCVDTTVKVTVVSYKDSSFQLCRTIQVPVPTTEVHSIYVVLADVIGDIDGWISYWRGLGVNETNLYARAYITTASKRSTLKTVLNKLHAVGIKANIDYRLSSEIASWEAYFATYTNPNDRPDGMVTEREPYVTGDYAGFYPFLSDGDKFSSKYNILLCVYMGQPTQACWDSIVFHADRVYLSNYIPMTAYAKSTGLYDYVKGRWGYITNSCVRFGKRNYPVVYITSLEEKAWGAGNDFMGYAYVGQTLYGDIWKKQKDQYNTNSTTAIKDATELIGTCAFYHKYVIVAIPRQ